MGVPVTVASARISVPAAPPTRRAVTRPPRVGSTSRCVAPKSILYGPLQLAGGTSVNVEAEPPEPPVPTLPPAPPEPALALVDAAPPFPPLPDATVEPV